MYTVTRQSQWPDGVKRGTRTTMTRRTAKRTLKHAFEHLRPFARGDAANGIPPNPEALAMSTIACKLVELCVDISNERVGKQRAQGAKMHAHYRPYFTFKDGREKFGGWHHSKHQAWEEVRKIIHGTDCQWANAECLAQNGYGVESYRVSNSAGDCQGE